MTAMELEQRKSILQEVIGMLDTEEEVARVEKYLRRTLSREQPPCQYTIEELIEHLEESEKDIQAGRVYTTEEVRSRFENKYKICR